jgi:hypothetical protein
MRTSLLSCTLLAIGLVCISTETNAGCTNPAPNLSAGHANVDNETINFNYRGDAFPLDVYSGYAAQGTAYCIRYEIENNATKPVERLYWPLASGLELETLPSKNRKSIAQITPPSYPPSVERTLIYAFLSEAAKTFAYQSNKQYPFLIDKPTAPSRSQFGNNVPVVLASSSHVTYKTSQLSPVQGYDLKEPTKFIEVGSEFTDETSQVAAESSAEWDGKTYTIYVRVRRNGAVKDLQAPLAFAMAKAGSASNIFSVFYSLKKEGATLPFEGNVFTTKFQSSATPFGQFPSTLYVIRQPITFLGPDGHVCFLAAVYSPIPIPEKLLSCSVSNI